MDFDLAWPFFAAALAVLINICSQAIIAHTIAAELEHDVQEPALNLPGGVTGPPILQFMPDGLTPPFVLRKLSRAFDAAQCLTIGLGIVLALVALRDSTPTINIVVGMTMGALSLLWLTATICFGDETYARFFHPRALSVPWVRHKRLYLRAVLFVRGGWAWPTAVAFIVYIVLGAIAL